MRTEALVGAVFALTVVCGCGAETEDDGVPAEEDVSGDSLVEPDHFGSAGLALASGDECDAYAPGSTVVLDARGYEPGAQVAIVMQFVGKEAVAVATVSADDLGGVRAEVELPASAAESLGGFELIGLPGDIGPTGHVDIDGSAIRPSSPSPVPPGNLCG